MTCIHCEKLVSAKGLCKFHYLQQYREDNKDRLRIQKREYVQSIPGFQKARYERTKEKQLAASAIYYQNNRERVLEASKAWRKANPLAARALGASLTAKRREVERRATPPWADMKAIHQVYKRAAELSEQTGIPHDVDHIVPLQAKKVSGLHVHWNLQPIPASINRSKQNKFSEVHMT